jgi:hypothetical protein
MGAPTHPDLTPDRSTLESTDRSDTVPLVGYLGEGCSDEFVRLYESVALTRWIEIPVAAIVDRSSGSGTDSPSIVWVGRDAVLALCESVRASDYEGAPDPIQPIRWPRP